MRLRKGLDVYSDKKIDNTRDSYSPDFYLTGEDFRDWYFKDFERIKHERHKIKNNLARRDR